jgi:hypothetical protein
MSLASVLAFTALLLTVGPICGQTIIADNFNVTGSGTGFGLGSGVNYGIVPPVTRLTGTAAPGLRYILTATTKASTAYSISSNQLRVTAAANPGRFTLSANATTPFDFASALGASTATPQHPVLYDISISMANSSAGVQRFSFALATAEGDASTWNFGLQLYRRASTDNFYVIGKRIDTAASGLAADLNSFITHTAPGTYGTQLSFLMRVTDAGSETTTFNSRVQLSLDGGITWCYDTDSDPDLPSGWRLNGPGRYLLWDVAGDAGTVTYDNFSVVPVPVAAALTWPKTNTANLGACPILKAGVSNTAPGAVTVTFYGREAPKPYPGPDFALAVIPDSQVYVMAGNTEQKFYSQADWIVDNVVSRNIAYVAHLGDMVQNGDVLSGAPNEGEWQRTTNGLYRLEDPSQTLRRNGLPYGCAIGNHEQEPNGDMDGTTTLYNKYLGVSHFTGKPWYGGHFQSNNDSHFDLFSASGLDFIVLYFEYGRSGATILDWANDVLATNQNRRIIVVTHHTGSAATPSTLSGTAQDIYDSLKANTNFFLMLGGHVDGEGSVTKTYNATKVHCFISDYQFRGGGGDGYMRMLYFSPSNNIVNIETYSPWLDQSETDADSKMSFSYNLQLPTGPGSPGTAYSAIATNAGVAPGSVTTCPWPGRAANKTYEWYVQVTDAAGNAYISPSARFTTAANVAPIAPNQMLAVTGDQPTPLTLSVTDINGDALTSQTNSPPSHGLLTSFDSERGTVTYLPARGFRGTDRFTFHASDSLASSSVASVTLNVGAPPDANSNGLPDAWEAAYGVTNPDADDDHDGQSNLAEYWANTNPTNAASVFRILESTPQTNGAFTLTWSAVGGTRYRVQYCDGTAEGGFTGVFTDLVRDISLEMDNNPVGSISTQSFTDTLTGTNRGRYYRIEVVP